MSARERRGSGKTTIQISSDTLALLREYCPKYMTYDEFVRRLLVRFGRAIRDEIAAEGE